MGLNLSSIWAYGWGEFSTKKLLPGLANNKGCVSSPHANNLCYGPGLG